MMEQINWEIPRISGNPLPITLKKGDQLFIVGANGSGKSALIQHFASTHPHIPIKRIIAHRQIWFDSGGLKFNPQSRSAYAQRVEPYNASPNARWIDSWGAEVLSVSLFDLAEKENADAHHIRNCVNTMNDLQKIKEINANLSSPFAQINDLFDRATLTVKLKRDSNEILATTLQGTDFSLAQMSDGERSATILAVQVIAAEPGTLFLIDEPERHLHRSIIEPFLSALFALRADCAFIISTHEIALPVANPVARVLMLRSCRWNGEHCEAWDVGVLEPDTQLPEDLKLAILGSRKRILFVEGTSRSLDYQLYTALFPEISVVPKGSCEEVQEGVLGLRGSRDKHHVEAFGLIDRDNRSDEEVERLAKKGVFALEVCSVESLYYCSDAIAAVARRQAESLGADSSKFIKSAEQKAIASLKRPKERTAERMAARRYERRIHERFLSEIPNWKSIMNNPNLGQRITVSIDSSYSDELNHFNQLVDAGEWDQLVARYPLRETAAFGIIAKVLKCQDEKDYEDMVIVRIRKDEELAKVLKERIGPLAEKLDQA